MTPGEPLEHHTPAASPLAELCREVPLRAGLGWSLFGVWYRHLRVYAKTLLANATPPVLEPLFFFVAVGIGLGQYMAVDRFGAWTYRDYVATGLTISSAMFTGVFETTFGTFVRLVFQKTYDAMLGTHLQIREMFTGELLFAASKGFAYSAIVLLVTMAFGVRPGWGALLIPVIGSLTAYLFASIGLIVTSYVKTINNFAFFTTGIITPLFFFSGTFFPIRGHYWALDLVWWLVPLTHPIELARAAFKAQVNWETLAHAAYLAAALVACHWIGLRRMTRRVLGK